MKHQLTLGLVVLTGCGQGFEVGCKDSAAHVQAKVEKINHSTNTKADVISELSNPDKNSSETEFYYNIYQCNKFKIRLSDYFVVSSSQ